MNEDAPPPLAQWLRALADEVERDPALAARLRDRVQPPLAALATPTATHNALPEALVAPSPALISAPEPPASSLTHRRRATRFGGPAVVGRGADLGHGIPDPFALLAERGVEGLRAALQSLRAGTLRAIIRAHQLDPAGKLPESATEQRLVTAIIAAVKRLTRGANGFTAKATGG